jgi:hypothetical protein
MGIKKLCRPIFMGVAIVVLVSINSASAATLICKSAIYPAANAAHKFTILLPANFDGAVGYRNEFGEFEKTIGKEKVGVGVIEWEFLADEERLDFFQYTPASAPRLIGFAVSHAGNVMIMRVDKDKQGMPFRFHSTYTGPFNDTITGTCE